ncbi:MAG: pyridoxamine 5'-phosphate oxidase family protein [Flavobacteriaceae bacterium]
MLDQILDDCKKQLSAALKHKKHPFRFFTLATQTQNGKINLRTVVLRDFDPEQMTFTIFTDARSKKVNELKQNDNTQCLFYDSKRMVQLIFQAKMIKIINQDLTYKSLPESNKKDYSSLQLPGSIIKGPDQLIHDNSKGHFIKIEFKFSSFEYLRLKRPNHIRAIFNLNNSWEGQFLAP